MGDARAVGAGVVLGHHALAIAGFEFKPTDRVVTMVDARVVGKSVRPRSPNQQAADLEWGRADERAAGVAKALPLRCLFPTHLQRTSTAALPRS